MSTSLSPLSSASVVPSPPKVPPPRPPPGAPKPKPSPAGMLFSRSGTSSKQTNPIPVTPTETVSPRPGVRKLLSSFRRSGAGNSSNNGDSSATGQTSASTVVSPTASYRKTTSSKIKPEPARTQAFSDYEDVEAGLGSRKPQTQVFDVQIIQSRSDEVLDVNQTGPASSPPKQSTNKSTFGTSGMLHDIAAAAKSVVDARRNFGSKTESTVVPQQQNQPSKLNTSTMSSSSNQTSNLSSTSRKNVTTTESPKIEKLSTYESSSTASPYAPIRTLEDELRSVKLGTPNKIAVSKKPLVTPMMSHGQKRLDEMRNARPASSGRSGSLDSSLSCTSEGISPRFLKGKGFGFEATSSPLIAAGKVASHAFDIENQDEETTVVVNSDSRISEKDNSYSIQSHHSQSPAKRSPLRSARNASMESETTDSSGMASRKTSTESESIASSVTFMTARKLSDESQRTVLSKSSSTQSLLSDAGSQFGRILPPPPPKRPSNLRQRDRYSLDDFEFGVTLGTGSFGRVRFAKFKRPIPNTVEESLSIAVKILKKECVQRLNQVEHIKHEKDILQSLVTNQADYLVKKSSSSGREANEPWTPKGRHPFIVQLLGTFQTETCLFMVMEFIRGGEFFCHLRMRGHMKNHEAIFYTASVATVFAFLHQRDIAYRDLKPENLMLDHEGYLKVVDFGFAKRIPDNKTFTLCGTPEYIAPEVLMNQGHGKGVDWWALGILTYEMLSGVAPFTDPDPMIIYQRIVRGNVQYPTYFDPDARSFLRRLLQVDLNKRYGCLAGGARDVMLHRWLGGVDFARLMSRTLEPPVVPTTRDQDDTSCFEQYPDAEDLDLDGKDGDPYHGGGEFVNFDAVCL